MIEFLGLVFGGLIRLAPEVLKVWSMKADHAHELAMTTLQLQIDQARATQQLDMVHGQADAAASAVAMQGWVDAIAAQSKPTGVKWVDALSATVRPILTYWWCLVLYTASKVCIVYAAVQGTPDPIKLAPIFVTEFDQMVIGSIFAFYFVDRSLRKMTK